MQLPVARHTTRLDEVARFYRDSIGLTEIGGFRGHEGYDGVFLAQPASLAHLELTSGGSHGAPVPHPESRWARRGVSHSTALMFEYHDVVLSRSVA